jgi:DNA polymerase-1
MAETKKKSAVRGYAQCIFGRRRPIPQYESPDEDVRSKGDRQAMNTPVQNPASDHNLFAAGRLVEYIILNKKRWEVIALVHDSIVGHVPSEEISEYVLKVRELTTNTEWLEKTFDIKYKVKFIVDFKIGRRWASMINWDGSKHSLSEIQDVFDMEQNRKNRKYKVAA